MISDNCNNLCFIIDSRAIEKAIIELKKELEVLTKLGNDYIDLHGEIADWMNGVILVRDDYLLQHAKSMAADQLDLGIWPLPFIDWERAAESLRERYFSINYNGVTYWIKKPE